MSRIDDYIAANEKARALRERIMRALAADSDALKSVTLAELDRIVRDNPGLTPEEYSSIIARDFQLSASKTKTLKAHLEEGQLRMAAMRAEMMESLAGAAITMNAEQLASAYRVNFPKISNNINRMVQTAMRQIINRKGDIGELQSMLEETEIGAHQAKTLANTALAQYDNHYTIALARQAGIARFEYHGPPAQRAFCRARLGYVYTIDEIRRMNNGQGLDVLTSCGGYNCRHQWLPVPGSEMADAQTSGMWRNARDIDEVRKQTGLGVSISPEVDEYQALRVLNAVGREQDKLRRRFAAFRDLDIRGLRVARDELDELGWNGNYDSLTHEITVHARASTEGVGAPTTRSVPAIVRHENGHALFQQKLDERTQEMLKFEYDGTDPSTIQEQLSEQAYNHEEAFGVIVDFVAFGSDSHITVLQKSLSIIKRLLKP